MQNKLPINLEAHKLIGSLFRSVVVAFVLFILDLDIAQKQKF